MNGVFDISALVAVSEWVFKSSLLLIAAISLTRFLEPRSSAAVRHILLRSSIVGSLLLAAIGPLAPVWQLAQSNMLPAFLPQLTASVQTIGAADTASISWVLIALSFWVIGIVALAGRYVLGMVAMARIVRDSATLTDTGILSIASSIVSELAITRQVRYMTSDRVSVPVAWGVLRPVVILPANSRHTAVETAMLLRHELAHVRRRDVFWLNLTTILTLVQWFNPLMWIVKRRLQVESEYACDNYVLTGQIEPDCYARHILETARSVSFRGALITTHMAFNSHLEGRIMSILNDRKRDFVTGRSLNIAITAILVVGCLTLAGFTLESCSTAGESDNAAAVSAPAQTEMPSSEVYVQVDTMPEMIYMESPVYPETAKKEMVEGSVWIKALVAEDGTVAKAELAKTSGDPRLDEAAVDAAMKNKFTPASQNGKAVSVWITYKVDFVLSDDKDTKKSSG